MGRPNIAEVGRRFSSEYQPSNRGRKKGSRNRRTVLAQYLRVDCRTPEQHIRMILDIVFGKKTSRAIVKRMSPINTERKAEAIYTI